MSNIRVGAFLSPTAMGLSSWSAAQTAFTNWAGDAPACTRIYLGAPPYSVTADMTSMINAGVHLLISMQPAYNPTSSTHLSQISTFLTALKAAGASAECAIWSEPVFSGLTSAQYIAAVQFYGPTIRSFYPLVFVTASSAVAHNSENTFYPGDSWVDSVATDFYAAGYAAGDRLDAPATPANNAVPPKPFGLWEFNGSPASTGQSQSTVTSFFSYIQSWVSSRLAAGLSVSNLCLFNGAPGQNQLGSAGTAAGGFEGGTGNWVAAGNSSIAGSTAQAHTGSGALAVTSSGAGGVQVASAALANFATQMLQVAVGDTVDAAVWFRAQVTGRSCQAEIQWVNSSAGVISTTAGGAVTSNATSWTQGTVTGTAPSGAVAARLFPVIAGAAGAGEVTYLDDPELRDVQGFNPQNVTTIEFPWDYRVALWQGVFAQFNGVVNPGSGPAVTLIQSNQINSGASAETSQTVTLTAGATLGNLLVVAIQCDAEFAVTAGPSGWTGGPSNGAGTANTLQPSIWYKLVDSATAGATSFTFTVSPSQALAVVIAEFHASTGWMSQPTVLDQVARGNISAQQSPSATVDSGTAPFTFWGAELWVAALGYAGPGQSEAVNGSTFAVVQDCPGGNTTLTMLWAFSQVNGSPDCSYQITQPADWAGVMATFAVFQGADSDAGSGSESQFVIIPGHGGGVTSVSSSDSGHGTDATGSVSSKFATPFSADAGTGTETQRGPATVRVSSQDYGAGLDSGSYQARTVAQAAFARSIFEGFSLSRAAVLSGAGAESGQLFGAQSVTITPEVTISEMIADDDHIGAWYSLNKATLQVTNGFMSWATISQLSGYQVSSSGTSPLDYYGLPLWAQYQHNQPVISMVVRMSSKNSFADVRTMDLLFYRVQLSVIDFSGMVYKQGLGVTYTGTLMFSSTDEAGNALASPEMGRIVSYAGTMTGAVAGVPFRGV